MTAILEAHFKVSAKFEMKKGRKKKAQKGRREPSNSHLSQDFDDKSRAATSSGHRESQSNSRMRRKRWSLLIRAAIQLLLWGGKRALSAFQWGRCLTDGQRLSTARNLAFKHGRLSVQTDGALDILWPSWTVSSAWTLPDFFFKFNFN